MEQEGEGGEKKRVCVTGAGGFLASWLVNLLLSKGYIVHATLRNPSDEKNVHLKKLDRASENLKLFKADLLDFDALSAAIAGCEGIFHVASPVPSTKVPDPEVEVVTTAVTGTLNVLRACLEGKVKRVVVVSSGAAVGMNLKWPKDKLMDEDCWSDIEHCRTTENWYSLSKTLAEGEALNFGAKEGLDVVILCPCLILGPLLQSTVNASSLFLINILKGNHESINNRVKNFVDVRDVADALLLVYESPKASGRYICAPYSMKIPDLANILKSMYPNYDYPKNYAEVEGKLGLISEKLKMLGWKYRPLEETLVDTVECYKELGLLNGK